MIQVYIISEADNNVGAIPTMPTLIITRTDNEVTMAEKQDPITFRASFPAIASAIIVSGDGNGLRLKLDVPETDLLQSLHIIAMRQTAFKVTIEPIINDEKQHTPHRKSTY